MIKPFLRYHLTSFIYKNSIIRFKIEKLCPLLFFLYYIIKIWNFDYIINSMRPTFWQKIWVVLGGFGRFWMIWGVCRLKKSMFIGKFPLYYNHLDGCRSLWNQLGELYRTVLSTIDLGVILGDFVFYKYPKNSKVC